MPCPVPSVPATAALWTSGASNKKTGDVPTLHIGETREESKASCKGCPMLKNGDCYSQFGTASMAHSSMIRANNKAKARGERRYTLKQALLKSKRSAKMARLSAIGDPGALPLEYLRKAIKAIRAMGLDPVGYTHHWRGLPELAGVLMASCDALEDCDQALEMGYRAAVVLPWDHQGSFTTPQGAKGIVCPAMTAEERGASLTCNECRLCDGSKRGPVIGFPNHGPKTNHKRRAAKRSRVAPKVPSPLDTLDI